MSNEDLAVLIQQGREDLYPELWDQVCRFVEQQARRRFQSTAGFGGVEVEDLVQAGYLAMVDAVGRFDPAAECSFLTVLGFCLKTAFAAAGGYRSSKRDMIDYCLDLDAPAGEDQDGTLLDTIRAPGDPYSATEERIYRQQLHDTLERAISDLPPKEADTIRRYYWDGQTLDQIGAETSRTREAVRQWRDRGLKRLKAQRRQNGLDQFVDERMNYYHGTGLASFSRTLTSSTERKAMRRIELSDRYKHLFMEDYEDE